MSYTKRQEDFLNKMYAEDSPEFGELCLTSADRMERGEVEYPSDAELERWMHEHTRRFGEPPSQPEMDMDFNEMMAEIELEDFERKNGRKPNYLEMSQGW